MKSQKHVVHVVGARPNFMKAAPLLLALRGFPGVRQSLVHTGQHYDALMSDVFFRQLEIPAPDANLNVGSGTHTQQTAAIMTGFEKFVGQDRPSIVVVFGDVNSTVAAAMVAAKEGIPVAHVEAGLRSFDRSMPEEINRLLTDQLSDLLFTPSADADENLAREGISSDKVHLVGNVMIDTLVRMLPLAQKATIPDLPERFILGTFHRAANVDDAGWLESLLKMLADLSHEIAVLFPVHPRTRQRLSAFTDVLAAPNLRLMDPLPYLEFLSLQSRAAVVLTDSGGIQEETTYLGVPCITVRDNTERPITVTMGTNHLAGRDILKVKAVLDDLLKTPQSPKQVPPLWDGRAAERIAKILARD